MTISLASYLTSFSSNALSLCCQSLLSLFFSYSAVFWNTGNLTFLCWIGCLSSLISCSISFNKLKNPHQKWTQCLYQRKGNKKVVVKCGSWGCHLRMSHHSQQHITKLPKSFVLTFRLTLEAFLSPGSIVCLFNVPNWVVHATGINNEHIFMVLLSIIRGIFRIGWQVFKTVVKMWHIY